MKVGWLLPLLLIIPLCSCGAVVSQGEYNKVCDELAIARAEIQTLEISKAELEEEISGLGIQIRYIEKQLSDAEWSLESLRESLFVANSERDSLNAEVEVLKLQLIPSPDHAIQIDEILGNPEFMSVTWKGKDRQFCQKINGIARTYYRTHTYIPGETDCNDMAVDLWNILFTQGIKSIIVVGSLNDINPAFTECDHTWLRVFSADGRSAVLEPTTGTVFYKPIPEYYTGFFFYYKKPSDLWADIKMKW